MDPPQEIDNSIKESIRQSSPPPLESKLSASEAAEQQLRDKIISLQSKLKEKDLDIERAKAEARANAKALRKFGDEKARLCERRSFLRGMYKSWDRASSISRRNRDNAKNRANVANHRAKEAEARVHRLEEKVQELTHQILLFKHVYKIRKRDLSYEETAFEDELLESILAELIGEDSSTSARVFLEDNIHNEPCRKLLYLWESLRPSTKSVLSLVAKTKSILSVEAKEKGEKSSDKENHEDNKRSRYRVFARSNNGAPLPKIAKVVKQ